MAVVASEDGELVMQDPLGQETGIVTATGEEADEAEEEDVELHDLKMEAGSTNKSTQGTQSDPKLQKEMETCFGFDEVSNVYFCLFHFIFSKSCSQKRVKFINLLK